MFGVFFYLRKGELMKRLILFLIRKKLGLKKWEGFRFSNQKSSADWYFINDYNVMKVSHGIGPVIPSNVSLNWLLDDKCEITKVNGNVEINKALIR